MPKHEPDEQESEADVAKLLMPMAQHNSLLKKAGVKNVPLDTLVLFREQVFPEELREFVRRLMVVTDYTEMKTVMPRHVQAAYKSMTGHRLIYKRHKRRARKTAGIEEQPAAPSS